ncbi:unnamed protein product [Aphis gossypii]|uniref:Uncharacterized protein n=1 Tax=Aphis gossypii TaxID=80765 RepID=A0A9P0NJN2_APHGO|nr:unnamed protein product [Aphis gossypii]
MDLRWNKFLGSVNKIVYKISLILPILSFEVNLLYAHSALGVNFQGRELLLIYHFVLLIIDVEMAKTPAERAREYRARKKLLTPQKPPPQTRAQRNRKYTARQRALRNAVAIIGENEAMTNFSGSRELLTVNPNNPQSSISRDDNNILYNYLSQTNGQSGKAQFPVENAQEIKVVQADMHLANLSQCAVNPISTTTKITKKSCAQRCREYRQRLKMMAEANAIVVQRPVASPIMNVSGIQVDLAQVLQPETIVIECDLSAASVIRQGNYG